MSVADKMSQAYLQGADDAKKQARQELEELRDLCDNQARIIESMQQQLDMAHSDRLAQRRSKSVADKVVADMEFGESRTISLSALFDEIAMDEEEV